MTLTKDILRPADICQMLGITRQTLTRWRTDGNFPPHIQLGERVVGWRRESIIAWMDERTCEK